MRTRAARRLWRSQRARRRSAIAHGLAAIRDLLVQRAVRHDAIAAKLTVLGRQASHR